MTESRTEFRTDFSIEDPVMDRLPPNGTLDFEPLAHLQQETGDISDPCQFWSFACDWCNETCEMCERIFCSWSPPNGSCSDATPCDNSVDEFEIRFETSPDSCKC